MRITRLQIFILFFVLIGVGFGSLAWLHHRIAVPTPHTVLPPKQQAPAAPATPPPAAVQNTVPAASGQTMSAQTIAVVGEAYRTLAKQSGKDIPEIASPLRRAKLAQTAGNYPDAMASAKEAWDALKHYQKTMAAGTYTVAKGDTLWTIAQKHSPVHQGPGWVAIWKANKKLVKNFDRIEVGWDIHIPLKRSSYVMPYWKPRQLASAKMTHPVVQERPKRQEAPEPIPLSSLPPKTPASLGELLFHEGAAPLGLQQAMLKSPLSPVLPPVQYH